MLGLNDYLAKNKMSYRNLTEIREISELIELNAAEESVDMAKRFGSFDAFSSSTWASGEQVSVFKSKSVKYQKRWDQLQENINKHGMHNSQLTSPAPNTSTSIYQEASASFLPVYSAFFTESNKNGDLRVAAKYLKQHPMGYAKTLSKFSAKEIIDVAAALQDYIDTGLSTELLFDQSKEGFTAKDLYDAIHYAHTSGLKTLYYIRSLKKTTGVDDEEACLACAG
jgi:ribonucleotide reductase alpha subunit